MLDVIELGDDSDEEGEQLSEEREQAAEELEDEGQLEYASDAADIDPINELEVGADI